MVDAKITELITHETVSVEFFVIINSHSFQKKEMIFFSSVDH